MYFFQALVTGAIRGIGEAIAITLSDYGAHCILASRKADGLKGVAEKIALRGGKADVLPCHVGDLKQIDGLFKQTKERYGNLHILINNAATNPHFGEMLNAGHTRTLHARTRGSCRAERRRRKR